MATGALSYSKENILSLLKDHPIGITKSELSRTFGMSLTTFEGRLKTISITDIAEDDDNGIFLLEERESYIRSIKDDLRQRVGGKVYINGKRFA